MRIQSLAGALVLLLLGAASLDAQGTRRRTPATKPSEPVSTQTATTKDGRTVILKSDGTWQFEPTTPPPSLTPTNNLVKQSVEANSLPPNFTGHDTKVLFEKLVDLKKRLKKSEFETTVEYAERVGEEKQKSILDGLRIYDKFFLVVPDLQADFNADLQKMKFFLPVEEDVGRGDLYSNRIGWGGFRSAPSDAVFFNDTNGLPLSGERYRRGFSIEISLSVEEAKRIKNTTKAILVVQFEEPYVLENPYQLPPRQFQVRLIDVCFFDQQTGKILVKMSEVRK